MAMPNKDPQNAPFGLRPVRRIDGTAWNGATNEYDINPNTAPIYFGDPVVLDENGTIKQSPEVGSAQIVGVFQGCQYTDMHGKPISSVFWGEPSDVDKDKPVTAFVCDDPMVLYEVQTSSSLKDAAGFSSPDKGSDFDIKGLSQGDAGGAPDGNPPVYGHKNPGPNKKTGISGGYLDIASHSATLSDVKALFLSPKPNNIFHVSGEKFSPNNMRGAYNTALVVIDNHFLKGAKTSTSFGTGHIKWFVDNNTATDSYTIDSRPILDAAAQAQALPWDASYMAENWPDGEKATCSIKFPKIGRYRITIKAQIQRTANSKLGWGGSFLMFPPKDTAYAGTPAEVLIKDCAVFPGERDPGDWNDIRTTTADFEYKVMDAAKLFSAIGFWCETNVKDGSRFRVNGDMSASISYVEIKEQSS